jgi:hypothetical protein
MNKQESRRIQTEIRRVLVDVWDPIGIKDVSNAQDEYDGYIGGVFELLNSGRSDEEISAYLWKVIEERIHIHPARGATQETVKALRRIRIG